MEDKSIYEKFYIRKEKFIQMLEQLDFIAIEEADIKFITCFEIDGKTNNLNTLGYKINIGGIKQ